MKKTVLIFILNITAFVYLHGSQEVPMCKLHPACDFLSSDRCPNLTEDQLHIDPIVNQFYFLRHGVTDWSKEMLALGPQDLPLNSLGIQQVLDSLHLFDNLKISRILTSNLKRCIESAEIISQYLGDVPIIIDNNLEERRFGNWATDTEKIKKLIDDLPEGPSFFMQVKDIIETMLPLDSESAFEFKIRVVDHFNKMYKNFDENTLIISHGCLRDDLIKFLNLTENNVGYKEYARPIIFKRKSDNSWSVNPVKKN